MSKANAGSKATETTATTAVTLMAKIFSTLGNTFRRGDFSEHKVASMLTSLRKAKSFAKGGLVDYGSTWGDTTHAFVNKGERIAKAIKIVEAET